MFTIEREDGATQGLRFFTLLAATQVARALASKPEHRGYGFFVKNERGQVVAARTRDD